ncbi:MAG TPA: hypothetical protein VJQ82_03390 [Terriglobales bacterium]|nr:hypothetical protein [Terriglobales bacterium]
MTLLRTIFCLMLLSVLAQTSPAATWTTLDVPGAYSTLGVFDINNNGVMVGGYFQTSVGNSMGFVDDHGTFTTVNEPNGNYTVVSGINDLGQMVGYYYAKSNGQSNGFYYDGTTFTTIDPPGSTYSDLEKINNNGQMVGVYVDTSNVEHAFEYDMTTATFTIIDPPDSYDAQAGGINNLGAIAGYYATRANGNLAFLLSNGTYQDITYPSAGLTRPYGINDSGEVVGSVTSPKGQRFRAFVYLNGQFGRLNFPGATFTAAYGINNAGVIVGFWAGTTNVTHGFIRTP